MHVLIVLIVVRSSIPEGAERHVINGDETAHDDEAEDLFWAVC